MIYIDSAAAVKLVHPEPETKDLVDWLSQRPGEQIFSSALIEVETHRVMRRIAPHKLPMLPPLLSNIVRLDIDAAVRGVASSIGDKVLRSLDAIHLATAMQFANVVDHFVTYDKRLLQAAASVGFSVASPGTTT